MTASAAKHPRRGAFGAVIAVLAVSCTQNGLPPSPAAEAEQSPAATAVHDEGAARGEAMLYRDPQGRFEVEVPPGTVLLSESGLLPERNAPLAGRVRFQLQQLVGTDVADREPPPLAIEIFSAAPLSLATWLDQHRFTNARTILEPATVAGATEALWVRDPAQLSPNETLWVAAGDLVYRLVPVGELGLAAIESFDLR